MKRNLTVIFLLIFLLFYCSKTSHESDISELLPEPGEVAGWNAADTPQNFKGEDLFEFINGGAEIYHEYGFKQVIAQQYSTSDDKSINLEIYEMTDPASAYGIYTFKTGDVGEMSKIGNEAMLEDYYMNFWKGNFLVTLIGFNSEKETIDGIKTIAKAVDAKIKETGDKPAIIEILPKGNLRQSGIKYFKGNLALFNHYEFDTANIFGVKEGIIGNYGNFNVFVFAYNDENESFKWFENAREFIKNSIRYTNFEDYKDSFYVVDDKRTLIYIKPYKNFNLITMGVDRKDTKKIIQNLEESIKKFVLR